MQGLGSIWGCVCLDVSHRFTAKQVRTKGLGYNQNDKTPNHAKIHLWLYVTIKRSHYGIMVLLAVKPRHKCDVMDPKTQTIADLK
jgi:hypothetical protein